MSNQYVQAKSLLISCCVMASFSQAQGLQVDTLAEGLERPWGLSFLNANTVIVTEKAGTAQRVNLDNGDREAIQGLPNDIRSKGQGGLMDVKVHSNGWLYFTYTKASETGAGATTLARAKIDGASLHHWQDLLVSDSVSNTGRHYGSRIAFSANDELFFGVGDRGMRGPAQDNSNHIGTLLRVNMEGKPLADNPFYQQEGSRPEIYSYGHRNPQGLAFDSKGQLWEIEHGPRGGDEINKVQAGVNYGWPKVSLGREYREDKMVGVPELEGMQNAEKVFIPSIAPSSLMIYSGKAFPQWEDHFFAGALGLTHLNRLAVNEKGELEEQQRMLLDVKERIRYVTEGPAGNIYLLTDSGKLLRLSPGGSRQ